MKRVPEGSLEYQGDGRYYLDDKPFTGVGYSLHEDGWLESEAEYQDGLETGLRMQWYAPDKPKAEAEMRAGAMHGRERLWHRNGQPNEEGDYEFGITLRRKKWDEDGKLVENFELEDKAGTNYKILLTYRAVEKGQSGKKLAALLRGGHLHPWQPGDPIHNSGPRILLGVSSGSVADLKLLDALKKAIGKGSTGPRLDIFNALECRPIQGFEEYVSGIGKVFQTPVVGYWQDGKLIEKAWGKEGRDLLMKVLGISL